MKPSEEGLGAVSTTARQASVTLATNEQIEAERFALSLGDDPEVLQTLRALRREIEPDPVMSIPGVAEQLDAALRKWTTALILREVAGDPLAPKVIWAWADAPRTWFGHTISSALSCDNPDAIYRFASIDGAATYEVKGRFPAYPAADFNVEPLPGLAGVIPASGTLTGALGTTAGPPLLARREILHDAEGNFRITMGPYAPAALENHLTTTPEPILLNFRDILSDWRQAPTSLSIRRLSPVGTAPIGDAEIRRRVLLHLPAFVHQWAGRKDRWLGGVKLNSFVGPMARAGAWSCLLVGRYALQPEQAMVIRIKNCAAGYSGAQLTDPWGITLDNTCIQGSLNNNQAIPDEDGDFTYVVATEDPGVANWLTTNGSAQGFILFRWQLFGSDLQASRLLRNVSLVDCEDVAKLPGVEKITPLQRRDRLAARAEAYRLRVSADT
jgi:hypothetical protein